MNDHLEGGRSREPAVDGQGPAEGRRVPCGAGQQALPRFLLAPPLPGLGLSKLLTLLVSLSSGRCKLNVQTVIIQRTITTIITEYERDVYWKHNLQEVSKLCFCPATPTMKQG